MSGSTLTRLVLGVLVLFAVALPSSGLAQVKFERTYGGPASDGGESVEETSDGGYILCGWTYSFGAGERDGYLIKVDSVGGILWTKTYGDTAANEFRSALQTSDGGYIMTGVTGRYGHEDIYLVKTDASGDSVWGKIHGGSFRDGGWCVQETQDGKYVITGFACSLTVNSDAFLMKTSDLGDPVWLKRYGGDDSEVGHSVRCTTDGGYIVAGRTRSFGIGHDLYLIRANWLGDTLWTRTYGGTGLDDAFCIEQTTDGGFIIAGQTYSFGADSSDVYVIKTNSLGDTLWTRTFGGSGYDCGRSVQQTWDGGYIVAGSVRSLSAGDSDVYLVKLDSSGDVLWTRTYGGPGDDYGASVRQTLDRGYVIVGATNSFGDVYLIKTDEDGQTGIGEAVGHPLRIDVRLWQNEPNPFHQSTGIRYCLPTCCHVTLTLYDVAGRPAATLVSGEQGPGVYYVTWDGGAHASGVYFYRLEAGGFVDTKKMVLAR